MPAVEARNLAIGYGLRQVASGLNLAAAHSEILCLLGPNGAGKTTLFRTLLGLIPPLAGDVRLDDRPISAMGRLDTAKAIAYVPQNYASEFSYTVLDMVLMGRTAHLPAFGVPNRGDRDRALAALAAVGVADLAEADSTRISGGQRQLVLIARALAQDARAIIMDEPTASLDIGNRSLVLNRISSLAADGIAVVFSTHQPELALEIAHSAAVVAHGRLLSFGPTADALTGEVLSEAYDINVQVETTPSGRRVVTAAVHKRAAS